LGGSAGIRLEEDLDDIGAGLETAGGMQGKISTFIQARGFFGKVGVLFL